MDLADQAHIIEQENLQRELSRLKPQQASRSHCIDCGIEIPAQRRKHDGVIRCIDCQNDVEANQKHYAKR